MQSLRNSVVGAISLSTNLYITSLVVPASIMSIFLMLMLVPDVGWRQNNGYAHYSRERLLYAPDPVSIEKQEMKKAEQELKHEGAH